MQLPSPHPLRDERLIQGVLANVPLCRGLPPAEIAMLARRCSVITARTREVIVAPGMRACGVFAVAYGTVKLAIPTPRRAERVVRLVRPGQTFGEASALLGRAASSEARALTACKVVVIPSSALFTLMERHPRTNRELAMSLAERNLEMLGALGSTSMRRGAQRVASYLTSLAEPARDGSLQARLPATKTVIASSLNMKKETFSRLLRTLSDQGLIKVSGYDITVLDSARLDEVVA